MQESSLMDYVGQWAVWTIRMRTGTVRTWVRTLDARFNYGRMDVEVKTNCGDRHWVSESNLDFVEPDQVPAEAKAGTPESAPDTEFGVVAQRTLWAAEDL